MNRANPIEARSPTRTCARRSCRCPRRRSSTTTCPTRKIGKDISCNLGSLNIAKAMDSPDFAQTIEVVIRALTAVSDQTHITSVPSIEQGNNDAHAIGLGQMNLHGYLARERIFYGSEEGIDFTNIYFYTVLSTRCARRTRSRSSVVRRSRASRSRSTPAGEFFDDKYRAGVGAKTEKVRKLFATPAFASRTRTIGSGSRSRCRPTASTTRTCRPSADRVDLVPSTTPPARSTRWRPKDRDPQGRQDRPRLLPGAVSDQRQPRVLPGRVRDRLREDHRHVHAAATQHVDQGLSLTLFFKDTAKHRDVNKAQIHAWRKGIKTLYHHPACGRWPWRVSRSRACQLHAADAPAAPSGANRGVRPDARVHRAQQPMNASSSTATPRRGVSSVAYLVVRAAGPSSRISAHWFINATAVTAIARPRTIHDFWVSARAVRPAIPSAGAPGSGGEIADVVELTWAPTRQLLKRIDHGTWSVLARLPDHSVPVVQLSINAHQPLEYHLELGASWLFRCASAALIVGSGNVVLISARSIRRCPDGFPAGRSDSDEAARTLVL